MVYNVYFLTDMYTLKYRDDNKIQTLSLSTLEVALCWKYLAERIFTNVELINEKGVCEAK